VGYVFVLGGGGAIGAFQAGSLLALAEAGIVPDALVGCSAGALNAAFLAADPSVTRARDLAEFWQAPSSRAVLAPSLFSRMRGAPSVLRHGDALLDGRPLRGMLNRFLDAHDVAEFAVPLRVTTTCLDCAAPVHHDRGPLTEILLASCALPGLLSPVRLPDGHDHVDGGVLCGVPVSAALEVAGPDDTILVLDAGLAPVTGAPDVCAAAAGSPAACGLPVASGRVYRAPEERPRARLLDVVLRSFTVARSVANRAAVRESLLDPRVKVLPHLADAWTAGILETMPTGPRDFALAPDLVSAGHAAATAWLGGPRSAEASVPDDTAQSAPPVPPRSAPRH
jgi:predicted acylesterase/phospholipase RssA